MALATPEDLATYLDRGVKTARAELAIESATAAIRAYIGADPEPFVGQRTVYLPVDQGRVRLPVLLDSVVAVTTIDDAPLDYTYRAGSSSLTLDSWWRGTFQVDRGWVCEVKVTYTYATAPAAMHSAALAIAATIYGTPAIDGSVAAGIRSESIDDYTVTYADASSTSSTLALGIPPDAAALLSPFRRSAYTIRVRV